MKLSISNSSFKHDLEDYAALLNLFGCVDVEYTSHEIRGLSIVIRLVKTLKQFSWPRLIQANEKSHLLRYNLELLEVENEFGEFVRNERFTNRK